MKFQVPQYIEVEDKVFGPFTFKQFIYLGGGGGFILILYSFLPLFFAIVLGAPVLILALALAFYKVNNRPFISIIESAFNFVGSSKLYLWKKETKKKRKKKELKITAKGVGQFIPKLSESKLKDLAWSLDIKESIYSNQTQQK